MSHIDHDPPEVGSADKGGCSHGQQPPSPTFDRTGGDKMLVDFDHNQKLPVWLHEGEKMVVFDGSKQSIWNEEAQKILASHDRDDKELLTSLQEPTAPSEEPKPRRICGLRRRWFYVAVASTLTALAVGIGAGLGDGLSSSHAYPSSRTNATSDYNIGGSLNQAYYSKIGAFNGSGFALSSQSISVADYGTLVLYFQHHDATIRWTSLVDDGWEGGTVSEIIANDAKNNTPISSVAFALNSTSTWHVFYVDKNNHIRERVKSNITSFWEDGALATSETPVFDSDQVAMQVCWYGMVYGDSDYANLSEDSETEVGLHLWYAIDNRTIQQLGWRDGDQHWTFQKNWTGVNPHAGVGCYSWGLGTTTYVMMANQDDALQIWAKNTNTSITANSTYPINEWVDVTPSNWADFGFGNLHPSTSISYTNILYAQTETNIIQGWDITWDYVNTSISSSFQIRDHPGIPGTHFAATAIPDADGGNELLIFYQTLGSDISMLSRDLTGDEWSYKAISVPAT